MLGKMQSGMTCSSQVATFLQVGSSPPTVRVAEIDCHFMANPVVSTVISDVPCPLVIVPAEIDHSKVSCRLGSPSAMVLDTFTGMPIVVYSRGQVRVIVGQFGMGKIHLISSCFCACA